jgi:hypothetical protein
MMRTIVAEKLAPVASSARPCSPMHGYAWQSSFKRGFIGLVENDTTASARRFDRPLT